MTSWLGSDLAPLPARPHVTVIVPAFDAARFIGDAVRSVCRSAYPAWTCVVVDDGSTDGTAARALDAASGDPRVTVVRQANAGHAAAINRAATGIQGEVVCFLDSDDLFLPGKLDAVIRRFRERPAAGLVVHRLYVTDAALRIAGVLPLADRLPDGDLRPRLRRSAAGDAVLGVTSGMALRREVFARVFPADPDVGPFSDELVRRIAPLVAEVAACDTPLGLRRTHGANQSDRASDGLERYIRAALASYGAIRAGQQRVAGELAFPLPDDDRDLELNRALLARLERRPEAPARRRVALASPSFAGLGPAPCRVYWRLTLWAPRRLVAPAVRQLYGVTTAKLLLNRRALRRLQRRGVVDRVLPRPAIGTRDLLVLALRGPRRARDAGRVTAVAGPGARGSTRPG